MTEVEWNEEANTLELTSRFFTDDIERRFEEKGISVKIEASMDEEIIPLLEEFYLKGLEIEVNGVDQTMAFLGYELDNDLIWCYAETQNIKEITKTSAECHWLTDLYEDQINIFKYFGPQGASTIHLSKGDSRQPFEVQ